MKKFILEFLFNKKNTLIAVFILFTVNIFSSLPLPYLSKLIIDDVLIPKNYNLISDILLIFFTLLIFQLFSNYYSNILSIKLIQECIFKLKNTLYLKIFNSKSSFNNHDIGNSQTILTNDTYIVSSYAYSLFWSFTLNIVLLVAYSVIMLLINIKLFFLNIILLPFVVYFYTLIGKKIEKISLSLQMNKDKSSTFLYENLFNSREIKVNDIHNFRFKKILNIFEENKTIAIKQNKLVLILNILLVFVIAISPIIIFAFGVNLVESNIISIGELITFISYQALIFSPIQALLQAFPNYKILKASYLRVKIFFEATNNDNKINITRPDNNILKLKNFHGQLSWNDFISINNFKCEKGQVIFLQGSNGSGKSVFSNLISGIHNDLTSISGDINLPNNISLLSCENIIYSDTLVNNIVFGNNINFSLIEKLFKLVNLEYLLTNLDKNISQNSLSSGEKEKILFIRELYKHPDFLIIDEAFSNLDKTSRENIIAYCKENSISLIIISHYEEIINSITEVKKYKIEKTNNSIKVKEVKKC